MILIWFLLVFFALVDPANAGPLIVAIAAFASTTIGGIVVNAVVGIVLSIGVSLIKNALAKDTTSDQTKDPGTSIDLKVGGDNPLFFPMGTAATGGVRVYCGAWGDAGKTPNEFAVNVIAVSCIPIPGTFNDIWFGDQKITVLTSDVKTEMGWPVSQYRKDGKDFAWIDFHDGTQTVADAYLLNHFGSDPDYPWKSDMIGRGVAYVTFTARYDTVGLWSSGLPDLTVSLPGIALYDIRRDSTAGGTGTQRWSDPSTWLSSENPMVQAYNVARGIYYGDEWIYGGQNWPAFRLPASSWIAGMNACGAIVDGAPSYRTGGIIEGDVEPAKTIEEFLKSSSGLIAEVGGIYKIRIGAPGAPVFAFTDANLLVTKEQGYSPFPGLEDTYNIVRITYTEPAEKYATKESPERRDADMITSDDGRELPTSVDLPFVLWNVQAQRVGKTALDNGRRFRRHNFYLPPEAWLLEPLDVVSWSSDHNGYINKSFDLEQIAGGSSFMQGVSIREVDPADYDWNPATDPLPFITIPLVPKIPAPQIMAGWDVEPYDIPDDSGIPRRPGVQVFYAAQLTDIDAVHIQVALASAPTVIWAEGRVPYDVTSIAPSTILTFQFLPNTDYLVRGQLVPHSDRAAVWSDWLPVKTSNLLISSDDIFDNAIIASKIADAAVTAEKIQDEAITNLKLADDAVTAAKIAVAAVTADALAMGAVTSAKIADGAATIAKFAAGLRPVEVLAALPTTGNVEGRQVLLTTDGKLYRFHAGAFTAAVDGDDITGVIDGAIVDSIAASKVTGQLTDSQIAAVAAAKVTGQIVAAQIANGAIDSTKFANGIEPVTNVAGSTIPTVKTTNVITVNGKLYRWNGTAYVASVASTDVTGQLTDSQIAAVAAAKVTGQVVAAQIAAGAVGNAQLAALAVDAAKLADNAITNTKIADNSISTPKLQANSVTAVNIAANSITAKQLVLTDPQNLIQNGSFQQGLDGWARITAGVTAITTATGPTNEAVQLVRTTVEASLTYAAQWSAATTDLAIPVSTGEQIYIECWANCTVAGINTIIDVPGIQTSDGATVNQGSISANLVANTWTKVSKVLTATTNRYIYPRVFNSVNNSTLYVSVIKVLRRNAANLIVDGSITANMILANSITATQIAAGAITASELAANAVTATQIAAGAVTTAKLAAGAVTAATIAANTITAAQIATGAINADEIAAGAITTSKLSIMDTSNLIDGGLTDPIAWGGGLGVGWSLSQSTQAADDFARIMTYSGAAQTGLPANAFVSDEYSNRFPVNSEDYYSIGGKVRGFTTTKGAARLSCIFYDSDLVNLGELGTSTAVFNGANGATGGDTALSAIVQAPVGSVTAVFRLRCAADASGNWTPAVLFRALYARKASDAKLIVDGSIIAGKIAADAVTATTIATGAVTADAIAANSVTAAAIAAGAVTTAKLAAGAVTAGTIAAGAVTAGKIAASAVTAGTIAADAVTTGTIAAGAVTATEIAANAVTAKQLFVGDFENMIADGNFDQSTLTDIWTLTGGPFNGNNTTPLGFAFWTGGSLTGGHSVTINNNVTVLSMNMVTKDFIPVEAGKVLGWEIAVEATTGGASVAGLYYRILWYDRTQTALASPIQTDVISNGPIPAVWTVYNGKVTIPATATYCKVQIYHHSTSTTKYLVIDRVSLRKAEAANLIVDGTITAVALAANAVTAGKIAAGAVTAGTIAAGAVTATTIAAATITGDKIAANTIGATQIAADSITAKQLVLTDFSNMADNGWQAGNLDGWTTFGAQGFGLDSFFGWVFRADAQTMAVSNAVAVSSGEQYFFDVWVFNLEPTGAVLLARQLDSTGTLIRTPVVTSTTLLNQWVRLQGQITIPSDVGKLAMQLFSNKLVPNGNSISWARPVMRRAASAELIVDGAITAGKIAANAVTAGKIAANAITAGAIAAGSITTDKLTVNGVTYDNLAPNSSSTVYSAVLDTVVHPDGSYGSVLSTSTNRSTSDALLILADLRANATLGFSGTLLVELWDDSNNVLCQTSILLDVDNSSMSAFMYYMAAGVGVLSYKIVVKAKSGTDGTRLNIGRRSIAAVRLNKST